MVQRGLDRSGFLFQIGLSVRAGDHRFSGVEKHVGHRVIVAFERDLGASQVGRPILHAGELRDSLGIDAVEQAFGHIQSVKPDQKAC